MAANIKVECGCFCVIFTGSYLTTKVQSIPTTDGSCFRFYRFVALLTSLPEITFKNFTANL